MTCVRDPLWWLLHGLQAHTSKKFSRIQNQNLYKDFWKFFLVEKKLHFPRCVGTNIDDFQWQAVKYLRHLPTRACRHVPTLPDFLIDDIMCICICTRSCICVFDGRHVPTMQDFLIDECLYLCATHVKSAKDPIESNNAQTSKAPTPASSKNCAKGQELHWSMTGGLSHMCRKAKPDSNWWPSLCLMQSQIIGNPSKWLKLLFCWMS